MTWEIIDLWDVRLPSFPARDQTHFTGVSVTPSADNVQPQSIAPKEDRWYVIILILSDTHA